MEVVIMSNGNGNGGDLGLAEILGNIFGFNQD